jgi:hypothetical protein
MRTVTHGKIRRKKVKTMNKWTILSMAMFLFCSCNEAQSENPTDSGTGETDTRENGTDTESADTESMIDFFVSVLDYSASPPLPVGDATVIIDPGAPELIVMQTNEAGQISVDVPAKTPLTVTIAKKDYSAVTYSGFYPKDSSEYIFQIGKLLAPDVIAVKVSGTIVGAPVGSIVNIYGGWSLSAQLIIRSQDPVPFSFIEYAASNTEKILFSAYSFNNATIETLGTALFEVDLANPTGVVVTIDATKVLPLQISVNKPVLDGQRLEYLDRSPSWQVAGIKARDRWVGFAKAGIPSTETGFEISAMYGSYPEEEMAVLLMLASNPLDSSTPYAYAWVPLETVEQSLDIHVLDSPQPTAKDAFTPGATISWNKVDEATDYTLVVVSPLGQTTWTILTENMQISFPRLPTDFDRSILPIEGKWVLAARNLSDANGMLLQSATTGGPSAWSGN